MKREREESSGVLSRFKETLELKGEEIYQTELKKLITRELDQDAIRGNVSKQTEKSELAGYILQKLYNSIKHIPGYRLFEDIVRLSGVAMDAIGDRPFYIYLSTSETDECVEKSNMFLAIIAMSRNKKMLSNFKDFICGQDGDTLFSGNIDESVKDFVYLDDVTFSGQQLTDNIQGIYNLDQSDIRIHVVIPYVNPSILTNINHKLRHVDRAHWYTTGTYPVSIEKVFHDIVVENPSESIRTLSEITGALVDSKYFKNSLFYTDLKIADRASIYPYFLLEPLIYAPGGGDNNLIPVVTNCQNIKKNRYDVVDDGNYCPYPIYKRDEWKSTMGELFREEDGSKSSKLSRSDHDGYN